MAGFWMSVEALRQNGFPGEAAELHDALHGRAHTISTEMIGEMGLLFRMLRRRLGRRLPDEAAVFFKQALREINKVHPAP